MQTSPNGIAFIKAREELRLIAYQDSGGTWTQGWGHITGITKDSPPITEDTAEQWLKEDLGHIEGWIDTYIHVSLNQNQFDALASLCFNEGYLPLKATLGHCLNDGDYAGASLQFTRWVFVGKSQVRGLVERRTAEQQLFSRQP